MILSEEYQDLLLRMTRHFRAHGVPDAIQMLKVQEEAGEVAEAYIGFLGLNPRKGVSHTPYQVSMELADVVITALVGIVMMGFSPDQVLTDQMIKAESRLNEAANSEQGVSNEHG